MPISSTSWKLYFSLNKEAAFGVTVADAALDFMRPVQNFAPMRWQDAARQNDAAWYGKPPFPTFNERMQFAPELVAQVSAATDLECLYAIAYVMGGHAAAQGDPVGEPNTWQHTMTWQDSSATPEPDYTSIMGQLGTGSTPGWRKKLTGLWLRSMTLSGERDNFVLLNWEGQGADWADAATPVPPTAVTAASLFKTQFATLKLGAPAAPSISAEVISFALTLNNNAVPKYRLGQAAGKEQKPARAEIGFQQTTGNLVVEVKDTTEDFFELGTKLEAEILLTSEDVIPTDLTAISLKITIPKLIVTSIDYGEEDRTAILTLNFDEGAILKKDGSTEPITILLNTAIDNVKILVNSP